MKQEKQDQEHDMCEIKIQQDFILKKKQNKAMKKKIPKIIVK
jgi:hypothetical protein